jgi:adenylate kinase
MRLIFIGPPGSGKGTQAKLLSQRQGLTHIATGDILREAKLKGTPEGRRAAPYLDAGRLVPNGLVNDVVNARFRGPDGPTAFIMDGYPRNVSQAKSFDRRLRERGLGLDAVIFLTVDDNDIIRRLSASARWSCPKCKATYNTLSKPPRQTGVCDECGTTLVQREDDKPETIRGRLDVYHASADKLLGHYRRQGLVIDVPGDGEIEAIHQKIVEALKKLKSKP